MRVVRLGVALATALTLSLGCQTGGAVAPGADHLFLDGRVYTLDPAQPWARAVAVTDGRIVYVGEDEEARAFRGSKTRVHDLDGQMLLPGFIDAHAHPIMTAGSSESLSIEPADDAETIAAKVARYARDHPEHAVLRGFGFSAGQFGPAGPHRRVLDTAVPDRPVILIDDGGHSAWANSRALELLGVDRDTPDPIPGSHYYKRDADGEPTGWMLESQTFMPSLVRLGAGSVDQTVEGAEDLFALWSSVGVTTIFDAGMSAFEAQGFEALARLDREQRLPFRIVASHMIQHPDQLDGAIERFEALRGLHASDRVRVGSIKIHNDGTLQARTAAMLAPYVGEPDNRGGVLLEPQVLGAFVTRAHDAGADLHIHAIGDRAVRDALDAVEQARARTGRHDVRVTMCHVEVVADEDLARFAALGVIVQTTPVWHVPPGAPTARALGPERVARLERFAPLVRDGVRVTFGSNFPASGTIRGISPLHNIEAALTRQAFRDSDGEILGGPEQRLSLPTLLRGYTLDAAYQLRLEDELGSIEVGKRADLIVLDRNLFEEDRTAIHRAKVRLTMVEGEVVHERGLRDWLVDRLLGL